jgi:hypothetical protein
MEAYAPEFKSAAAPDGRAFRRRFSVARNAGSLSDLTLEFQHLREPFLTGRTLQICARRISSRASARKLQVSHPAVDRRL